MATFLIIVARSEYPTLDGHLLLPMVVYGLQAHWAGDKHGTSQYMSGN